MDPPSGWVFEVENGFYIKAGHFQKLVDQVRRHLEINKHEIPINLEEVIEHYICLQNPQSVCTGDGPKRFFPSRKEVESATKAILAVVSDDGKQSFCSQEEAEQRAAQCVDCRNNLNIWGCFLCTGLMKLITKIYKRSTKQDSKLKACGVCRCVNAAQVHLSEKVLVKLPKTAVLTDYPDPPDCWKRALLEKELNNGGQKEDFQEKSFEESAEIPKGDQGPGRVQLSGKSPDDNGGGRSSLSSSEDIERSQIDNQAIEETGGKDRYSESVDSGTTERESALE